MKINTNRIIGKRVKISILLIVLPILIVWSVYLIFPLLVADLGGPIEYYVEINLISDSEVPLENPVNLTTSEVLSVPILHEILEEIISNESITSISRLISEEEATSLTLLFANKGFPLTGYRQFYYDNKLFEVIYDESIS
ncbi:MAG: hypothetical protein ACXAB2_09170 [Candidatus Hodarchaeales archaeon]